MSKFIAKVMGASLVLAPFFSAQAVTVVDSASTQQQAQEAIVRANNAANAELFNRLQLLQEEVMRTRGMLEEQQHQLRQLKEQRMQDYKNLDKRISELAQRGAVSAPASVVEAPASLPAGDAVQAVESAGNEFAAGSAAVPENIVSNQQDALAYQKAYELIKQRKFEQARDAFAAFISRYPDSSYRPNAYYWLGELYIIEGNFPKAKTSFQAVLKDYPTHAKHPEALYKIATVNYELGDRTTAKLQMEQLIDQYGSKPVNAVAKARDFLKTNFP